MNALVAYGVTLQWSQLHEAGVDFDVVERAGFEFSAGNYRCEGGPVFLYIPGTAVDLSPSTRGLKEVSDIKETENDVSDVREGNEVHSGEKKKSKKRQRDQHGRRLGAVIEVPFPTKKERKAFVAFLKEHGLIAEDADVEFKAQIFYSC